MLLVDARLYAAAWGHAHAAPLVRCTNNPAAFPGADALAEFAAGSGTAAVAIRCDRPHERAGALEQLRAQVEAGVLRAVWVPTRTEPSYERSGGFLDDAEASADRSNLAGRVGSRRR